MRATHRFGVAEITHGGSRFCPDESRVLAHLDFRKWMRRPTRPAISERVAGNPSPTASCIAIPPGPRRRRVVVKERAGPANLRVACAQRLDLLRYTVGRVPVVVVPVNDELAVSRSAGDIAFRADVLFSGQPNERNRGSSGRKRRDSCRAVVDDDELQIRIVLSKKTTHRVRHKMKPVARGHDAGDQRRRFADDRYVRSRRALARVRERPATPMAP